MQTLEYRTIDKASWGAGPWQSEPDKRQWMDETTGLPCLIVRGPLGALCGYVGVPNGHLAYGKDYDSVGVEAHGGLTFSARCQPGVESHGICHKVAPGEPDDVWWLGFDCAHSGDLCPGNTKYQRPITGDTYRDIPYVTEQITALAAQLKAMGSGT